MGKSDGGEGLGSWFIGSIRSGESTWYIHRVEMVVRVLNKG